MQKELSGTLVTFSVKPGGSISYEFEALSRAKKPARYVFTGTVETYLFDREDAGYVRFTYSKVNGVGGWNYATAAARERWSHVVRFIRSEVIPAARAFSTSAEYEAEKIAAIRDSLEHERKNAERHVSRCERELATARGELAGAVAKLASFDEQYGTAPE